METLILIGFLIGAFFLIKSQLKTEDYDIEGKTLEELEHEIIRMSVRDGTYNPNNYRKFGDSIFQPFNNGRPLPSGLSDLGCRQRLILENMTPETDIKIIDVTPNQLEIKND